MTSFALINADLVGAPTIYPGRHGCRVPPGIDHVFLIDQFAPRLPAAWVALWNGEEDAPADVVWIGRSWFDALVWIREQFPTSALASRVGVIDLTKLREAPSRADAEPNHD
jgi:hypothetical protein